MAPAPAVDWSGRLAQARGDDEALLALMRSASLPLPIKQAAVEALQGEAALKQAERELRGHDRRAHQVAKRRLQGLVAQRQAREQATRLIASARHLAGQADLPANLCVEIDRAWQALDAAAIEPAQRDEYAALAAQLTAQLRQRGDLEQQRKRWHHNAVQALRQLQSACTAAAAGTLDRAALAAAVATAGGLVQTLPPEDSSVPAVGGVIGELQRALQTAAALDGHLAVLDSLLAGPTARTPARDHAPIEVAVEAEAADDTHQTADIQTSSAADARAAWLALPPLPDPKLAASLQARYAAWQQAREREENDRQSQRRDQARERQRARKTEHGAALADAVAQAEAALDAGRLADAHHLLTDIDDGTQGAEVAVALRNRIAAAEARLAQLRGWQHWAGGRARDELVLQAEALAAATVARHGSVAAEAEAEAVTPTAAEAEVARLSIRERAEVIATLRARWKEIDRVGGAGSRALWQRFDAALKIADEPVAAHAAAQRAARETNLAARRKLLDLLEAAGGDEPAPSLALPLSMPLSMPLEAPLATPVTAPSLAPPSLTPPSPTASDATVSAAADGASQPAPDIDARARAPGDPHTLATALDRFHLEWRRLGPIEHTVPRAARAALVERMAAAVRRVDAPLQAARLQARAQRQALLGRARTLAGDVATQGRDLVGEVRSLQAEWQRQAKALPLARGEEQALWTEFKGAIDAAFAARDAVYSARDAEYEAHAAERTALIERLQLRPDAPPAAQRRLLAEVDAAWQRCGPAPRARAAALDAAYRAARDALRQWLDESAQRAWQASCDGLDAKLALCLAREGQGAGADTQAIAPSWQALPVLPAPLEDALRRRAGLAAPSSAAPTIEVDDLLLQLETAWDLPTPPAHEAARRERKLLAMKAALEGRRAEGPEALAPDAALGLLLGHAGLGAGQQARLDAVLTAWRRRGPQRTN